MERVEQERQNNVEKHKEIQIQLDSLDIKVTGIEKEIIKLKVHFFYLFLFFQVIVAPLVSRALNHLFP